MNTAQRSRNQIVLVLLLVLVLDCFISDYADEDDDEDERFARRATIWTDTDSLQVCATGVGNLSKLSVTLGSVRRALCGRSV